jgi:tungstate transport system ATP-binding protein
VIQGSAAGSPCTAEAKELSVVLGGHKVLDIPSLQVYPNEVLVIVGPNGSGKTTLLLCLALLLSPATGMLRYGGVPILDSRARLQTRRRLAVVFQESLLLNGTVWDNVTLGLRLRGVKGSEIEARAREWLQRFGIAHLRGRQAKTLSSGEAKRASLARAFVLQPEVLFLDEPFDALDGPTRQAMLEDFEGVLRETRVTTVMVTHDRNEALLLADRIGVLMDGSIRQIGTPQEVFSSPVDEDVASFVEAGNILRGVVTSQSDGLASVGVGAYQLDAVSDLTAGTHVAACLHFEDITLSVPSRQLPPSSARNHLTGKVVKLFPFGSQVRISVDCGFPLVALITRRSWEDLGLGMGQTVVCSFKASSIRLITRR